MLKRLHKLFVEIHRIYNGVKPYEKCRKCMKEFRKVLSISMESMAAIKSRETGDVEENKQVQIGLLRQMLQWMC